MSKRSIPLARYLFTRLKQQGVQSLFGVPGDFTLKSLDYLKPCGIKWIGNCNELNAGYAADGYARVRGLGALSTTYGVGEISALNAIACSYAESVPVVHIVGTPHWHLQQSGAILHHSLGDGRTRIFSEVYEKFTVAQANLLDPEKAPEMIDDTLERCMAHSKPVYMELPSEVVSRNVSSERLNQYQLKRQLQDSGREKFHLDILLKDLYSAKRPLLLVDRGDGVQQSIREEINEFARVTRIPTLTVPSGAGMIDDIPNYYGVHAGQVGQIDTMPTINSADMVIAFGPLFSDTQTLGWSVVPDSVKTTIIGKNSIRHGSEKNASQVNAISFMRSLLATVEPRRINSYVNSLGNYRTVKPPPLAEHELDQPVDQTTFYLRLNEYFRPNDIVLLGNGTPILGGRDFLLPPGCQVIASGMSFSIGHMLPAALGAAKAQQEKDPSARTILVDGDGNVQVTIQEISTIIRQRLNVTIFIINNDGYAYERHQNGMNEVYNDVAPWRYLDAANFFGAGLSGNEGYPVTTVRISTWQDLQKFIDAAQNRYIKGLVLVEVIFDKYDVPKNFLEVFRAAREKL